MTPIVRTAHVRMEMYFGVCVPCGLLKPPGISSSTVAAKPFAKIAPTATRTVGQTGKCCQTAIGTATRATIHAYAKSRRKRFMPANGEVEGPDDHGRQGPRARNIEGVPRPQTDHASRPPPTIVRQHAASSRNVFSLGQARLRRAYRPSSRMR